MNLLNILFNVIRVGNHLFDNVFLDALICKWSQMPANANIHCLHLLYEQLGTPTCWNCRNIGIVLTVLTLVNILFCVNHSGLTASTDVFSESIRMIKEFLL